MLWLLPLLVAVALVAPFLVAPFSHAVDVRLTRIALAVFGDFVSGDDEHRRSEQKSLLRAAHVGRTHRIYASRTLLTAVVAGVAGTLSSVYFASGFVFALGLDTNTMLDIFSGPLAFVANLTQLSTLDPARLLGLFVLAAVTAGPVAALGTYWARWRYLGAKANARATGIDATLPRTVAFVYALSRSGMPFTKVLRTLDRNRSVYGESAAEISVAVRDMDAFSTDVLTALGQMADRTPSEGLEEFSDNLASVLGSGRNLPEFLHEQYERYREEAEALQEQYLDLLSIPILVSNIKYSTCER